MTAEQKTPFAVSISDYVQSKLEQNRQNFGWQLPCRVIAVNGAIVTVNFEIDTGGQYTFPPVTCPIAQSIYVRLPVQIGDLGMCISADARLGGITGLGVKGALSPLGLPFNLGALVYVPLGANDWSSVDPNAVNINAPNGVVIRDTNNQCTITLTPSGVTIVRGSTQVIINDTGITMYGNLLVHGSITGDNGFHITGGTGATMQITGDIAQTGNFANTGTLTNNGVNVGSTHEHSGVQTGGSNTGVPI
jgi:phage gp45-like